MTHDRFYFHRVAAAEKLLRNADHLRIDLYSNDGELALRVELTGDIPAADAQDITTAVRELIDEFTAGK